MSENGYRVECDVCGRSQMSGHSPMQRGWPMCCGYTMRLTDTKRFIENVDREVGKSFAHLASEGGVPGGR